MTRALGAVFAIAVPAFLLAGCRPVVRYLGDPAQRAFLADAHAFESELAGSVRSAGYALDITWFEGAALDGLPVESAIAETDASVVALSPYLSSLRGQLAVAYPGHRFVSLYSEPTPATQGSGSIVHVQFDARDAMEELGAAIHEWIRAGEGRSATLFALQEQSPQREESDWLANAFRAAAGVSLPVVGFERLPGREEVRAAVQRLEQSDETLVVLLLGASTGYALEFLRDEPVSLALRYDVSETAALDVVFAVIDPIASAVGRALSSEAGILTVASELRVYLDRP